MSAAFVFVWWLITIGAFLVFICGGGVIAFFGTAFSFIWTMWITFAWWMILIF